MPSLPQRFESGRTRPRLWFCRSIEKGEAFDTYTAMCPVCCRETNFRRFHKLTWKDMTVSTIFYTEAEINQSVAAQEILKKRKANYKVDPCASVNEFVKSRGFKNLLKKVR